MKKGEKKEIVEKGQTEEIKRKKLWKGSRNKGIKKL